MARTVLVLALVAALGFVELPRVAAEHPIAGVISLLEQLEVETKKEGAGEAAAFQKFQYWCKRSTRRLGHYIKKEKKLIVELKDKVDGLTADIATLEEDIKTQEAQLETLDQQASRAKRMRGEEHAQYSDEVANLDQTIVATDDTIHIMEDEEAAGQAENSFLQTRKARKDPELLKLNPGKNNPFKPKAKVFSTHEGGVIETFKHLEEGWSIDKLSEEEQETNALNAYNLAKQARDTAIKTATDAKTVKESVKSDKGSEKAATESSLAETEKMLSGDTATLEDTDKECQTKTQEWDERSKTRSAELEAMAMAKKILSKVTGVRNPETHEIPTKALLESTARVQQDSAAIGISFLQLDDPKVKAVTLLRKAASAAHNKALEKLAKEISAFNGPFDKIKAMIQKMVYRLMAEQKDEDEHKLWCDLETEKSTESKDDKTEKKNLLENKISEMDAAIKLLVKQIMENNAKVESITTSQKEETALRDENRAEIRLTIKDSQDAITALNEAIAVLKDFYKESGMIAKEPWEFVQTGSLRDVELPDSPATWDASYTGTADPKNGAEGILTILEETMQKFSKMEADAKVADETDQKDYENDMAAKKIEIDETNMDTQMKTQKKDSTQEKMEGAATQLKHTSSELDAVEQYLKDLEPACGTGDSSYDDRKKARADEIEALRKAQTILEEAFRAGGKFLQKK